MSSVNLNGSYSTQSSSESKHPNHMSIDDFIFYQLILALSNKSDSLEQVARELGASAEQISQLNDALAEIKTVQMPDNATTEKMDNINLENQNVNNHRSVVNNDIMLATNAAKTVKSIFQTLLSGLEQDTSATGNMMKIWMEIGKLINELAKRA